MMTAWPVLRALTFTRVKVLLSREGIALAAKAESNDDWRRKQSGPAL